MDVTGRDLDVFQETVRLFHYYTDEAVRCQKADAYLGGCVFLASALEAALLIMVQCYHDEVREVVQRRRTRALARPPSEWGLSQLLTVARELNWLPSTRTPGQRPCRKNPRSSDHITENAWIGDYVEVVRFIRNLIHPSIYLRQYCGEPVTDRMLDLSFKILDQACSHLRYTLCQSLAEIKT